MYYSEMTSQNMIDQPHYIDELNNNRSNRTRNEYRPVSQTEVENRPVQQENPGFFSRWIVGPVKWLGSFFCNRDNTEHNSTVNFIFDGLPDVVDTTPNFISGIKNKIGLLILYNESHNNYFEDLIRSIKQQDYIVDILV